MMRTTRSRRDRRAVRPRAGRRVPGHERAAGADPDALQAGRRGRHGRGRRRAGDLLVPRRDGREHPRTFRSASTPPAHVVTLEENYRSTQAVLDAANALMSEGRGSTSKQLHADKRGAGSKPRYVTVADDQAQARLRGRARARGARARRAAASARRCCSAARTTPTCSSSSSSRRNIPYVKYGGLKFLEAAHVKDLLARAALGRQPEQPHRRVSRAAAAAGRGARERRALLERASRPGLSRGTIAGRVPHAAPRRKQSWSALIELLADLANARRMGRAARARARVVRAAPRAHLRRRPGARRRPRAARASAQQYATREQFLTEMALDPPQATGDLAGAPHLDEDYLDAFHRPLGEGAGMGRGVHAQRRRRQFPVTSSPPASPTHRGGAPAAVRRDDARKNDLHLIAPLKYYVTQQSRIGDTHVYGARSRFLTDQLMAQFEQKAWPAAREAALRAFDTKANVRVDAAAALRAMWE